MTMTTNQTQPKTPVSPATLVAAKDVDGFKLSPHVTDVRRWPVLGPDAQLIGTVDRYMLDVAEKKPRYLAVTLIGNKGYLLLPVGLVRIDAAKKQLVLDSMTPAVLKAMPVLNADIVTHDFELEVYGALTGKPVQSLSAGQWYADPLFDPAQLFGSQKTAKTS